MNVFATSSCPIESAVALDDKRLIKMILESAQLLSTAVRVVAGEEDADRYGLYRKTHVNHPCAVWVRSNVYAYNWLVSHAEALLTEYTRRFDKRHASHRVIWNCASLWGLGTFEVGLRDPLDHPNCAKNSALGLDFSHLPVHEAYRDYLRVRWQLDKKPPRWTNASPPPWL